jgi:hypothetical protein
LKYAKTDKPVGNISFSIDITGKSVPKPVNHFLKKSNFLKKSDSLSGLSKTDKTDPDWFFRFSQKPTGFSIYVSN